MDFEEIFLLNDNLYVIGSVYNKKDKIFNLVATQVSDKGVLSKSPVVLFDAEVAKKSSRGDFYFKLSPDEGALLVMHTSLFSKEDAVKYEVKLFDDKMGTLFSNTEKVKFDDSKKDYEFTISDFEVNFQDDVFLVVNESYRDSKKKEQIEKFEIHAFKRNNGYKKEIVNIDIKGKEIINCKMISTNKNTLKIVGFYSSVRENGKANKELKGVYNATIDLNTNSTNTVKFNEFDYATKVKLLGERRAKKGKDVKPYYNITTIIEKNDGGSIQIPLTQLGKGPEYLGAIPIYKNGVLNLLFNDNVKNKGITNIDDIRSLGNYNNAVPALFIFDSNGNMTRKDPEEVIKNELVLRPGVYYRKSDKEFIVYSSRKSKDKLGRMILED